METNEKLELLSWCTNRSTGQTKFLFDLCDGDFDILLSLEARIKKLMLSHCPGDKKQAEKILKVDFNRKYTEKEIDGFR